MRRFRARARAFVPALGLTLGLAAWLLGAPVQAAPGSAAGAAKSHVPKAIAGPGANPAAKPTAAKAVKRQPLTLAAQNIEGRAEGARVLFVHTGPKIALEDAPRHPSYLRDDFTAALSSPVTVHVRNIEPLRTTTTPGGSR